MADPTQTEPQKIDPTQPGSKIFDPDPSLGSMIFRPMQVRQYQLAQCKFA